MVIYCAREKIWFALFKKITKNFLHDQKKKIRKKSFCAKITTHFISNFEIEIDRCYIRHYSPIVKYIHDVVRHLLLFLKIRCASLSLPWNRSKKVVFWTHKYIWIKKYIVLKRQYSKFELLTSKSCVFVFADQKILNRRF